MGRWSLWPWPFFDDRHKVLAGRLASWTSPVQDEVPESGMAASCRSIARSLGEAGLLETVVPRDEANIDVRSLCIAREAIAYHSALADSVIAMQGIGTGALWLHGTARQKARYLDRVRRGE